MAAVWRIEVDLIYLSKVTSQYWNYLAPLAGAINCSSQVFLCYKIVYLQWKGPQFSWGDNPLRYYR